MSTSIGEQINHAPLFDQIAEFLRVADETCAELNLRSSVQRINRIQASRELWTIHTLPRHIEELIDQVEDDLKAVFFVHVPLSKIEYYDKPYFGENVEARFKDAIDDMREAATCFALNRWTGVVHHCMGVVQVGMIDLGNNLGCPLDKYLHDWNEMMTALQNAIDAKRTAILGGSKTKAAPIAKSEWAKLEPFYSEVLSDVRDMKNAWRNPGFHFRLKPFDEAKAKKVLEKVRDFMTNLAEGI